jgi:AraC-like DNA-binding protein
MTAHFPLYRISAFHTEIQEKSFYSNRFSRHLKEHHFTNHPHTHDFYLVIYVTKGSGTHQIDFHTYQVKPGSLFLLWPGQLHSWSLSENCEGYVFFHTREFFDGSYHTDLTEGLRAGVRLRTQNCILVKQTKRAEIEFWFASILTEYLQHDPLKWLKIQALVSVVYIDISRIMPLSNQEESSRYMRQLESFELLIEENYRKEKLPSVYATKLHITERHLNRICRSCLKKSPGELINERILLEAKRLLTQKSFTVLQIADELGFLNPSYFSRMFRKKTGFTPKQFRLTQNSDTIAKRRF